MSKTMIELEGVPQATRTSWAVDRETGAYALVLEDDDGKPIASAAYRYERWIVTMETLRRIHMERARKAESEGK